MKFLSGLKTYIAATLAVMVAILAWYSGQLTVHEAVQAVFLALGLGTVRWSVELTEFVANITRIDALRHSDKTARYSTYISQAVTILAAVLSAFDGQQAFLAAVLAILGALGISFLGAGNAKAHAAAANATPPPT